MPVNNFSVGRDLTFSLVLSSGVVTLNGLTDYQPKPATSKLKHKALDGKTKHAIIPDGWEITIKLDRQDPVVDQLFAGLEAAYFAGVNTLPGSITESIQEKDGTVSQYQYADVAVDPQDVGNWKGDALVSQTIMVHASTRTRLV